MRKNFPFGVAAILIAAAAPAHAAGPFDAPSNLPYQAPRFDIIKDKDYQPAFEQGMRQQLAEMEAISRANLYAALSTLGAGTQKSFVTRERFDAEWTARG